MLDPASHCVSPEECNYEYIVESSFKEAIKSCKSQIMY